MSMFELGRLNGKWVVYWYETSNGALKRRRFRLKAKTKADARAEAHRRYDVELALKGAQLTFAEIWKRYETYLTGRRTQKQLIEHWKLIGPILGSYNPLHIDDDAVRIYLDWRREDARKRINREIGEGTLHNEVGLIQSTLNFAYKKNIIKEKPQKLIRPKKPPLKERALDNEEIHKLLSAAKRTPHLHVAIVLMLSTAGRISAILELTWDRVDFENKTIDLRVDNNPHGKNAPKFR
jgi:integrase